MDNRKLELILRTKSFAGRIVRLYVGLPLRRGDVMVLGRQMLRSGASVLANCREAVRARSKDEFVAKIELCGQEADVTRLWLELLRDDCSIINDALTALWSEANELIAIFVTMAKRTKDAK